MDRSKIIKMVVLLAVITLAAAGLLRMLRKNSMSLAEYESLNLAEQESLFLGEDKDAPGSDSSKGSGDPEPSHASDDDGSQASDDTDGSEGSQASDSSDGDASGGSQASPPSRLTGASLNGDSQAEERVTYEDGFYYEPISHNLRRYMTGISYPGDQTAGNAGVGGTESASAPKISLEELRYVHILHYDFDGSPAEGELICNESIARDLVEIFYELYCNEYRLEKVLLIDEYDGDDISSMEDNNTSCFNYRPVAGSSSLSRHAYGLAIDINPLYNPYITYSKDGTMNVSPASGADYADRSLSFPYKIDEDDLCYKLFIQHGFTWGGSWNHSKDYQHFQKAKP